MAILADAARSAVACSLESPAGDDVNLGLSVFLEQFHTKNEGAICIAAEQASRFAKEIAGDFNPIHDVGAKRFCVPGDLLFALVLARYGVSERMRFQFKGMVGESTQLRFPEAGGEQVSITDDAGREYLSVERGGANTDDPDVIEGLMRRYVAFSGTNFPHILVPLMQRHEVMVNPDRPLIVYESMSIELDSLALRDVELHLGEIEMNVAGKRGDATLSFEILSGGESVGRGSKKLLLSGLRPYDDGVMQDLIDRYEGWRASYEAERLA